MRAADLCEALGLPKSTVSFELRVRVNEIPEVRAVVLVPDLDHGGFIEVVRHYTLQENLG